MAEKKTKLAEIKTKQNSASVEEFINSIENVQKRNDSLLLLDMMSKISGEEAKMWGSSIVGFGNKIYQSPTSGRQVDWFLIGFSPRKTNVSLYLNITLFEYSDDLVKLGKHKAGVGCLYVNKLADIDLDVLKSMIEKSYNSKV